MEVLAAARLPYFRTDNLFEETSAAANGGSLWSILNSQEVTLEGKERINMHFGRPSIRGFAAGWFRNVDPQVKPAQGIPVLTPKSTESAIRSSLSMKVSLKSLQLDEIASVTGIKLGEGKADLAGGNMEAVSQRVKGTLIPHAYHPFLVMVKDQTAGFFMLREGTAVPSWVSQRAISLHNFRISQQMQGRGYGRTALILAARWIAVKRANVSELVLSVNAENTSASRFYLSCGFQDAGVTIAGRLGMELVLSCRVAELAAKQAPGE